MHRFALPFVALTFVATLLFGCSSEPERRANVLLVVLDTTRADFLSAYGHDAKTTPHIDRLAREGGLFERAFSTTYWTLPAHASLMTGQYPSRHQATSETVHLPQTAHTLAERLASAGYRTGGFVSNPWVSVERGFGQGFETYLEAFRDETPGIDAYVVDRRAVTAALDWIGDRPLEAKPFFAFLNLNSVHLPFSPDPQVLFDFTPEPRPLDRVRRVREAKGMWGHLAGTVSYDELDYQIMKELYEADVAMIDRLVGQLVAGLAERGALDDTLVIVTSDHGENMGDHGMVDHMLSMYETTIHIPLVMRFPERIEAGQVRGDLVSLVDVLPTVLDACGLDPANGETAGRSLLSGPADEPPYVIAENTRPSNGIAHMQISHPSFDTTTIDGGMRMLRTRDHKLIWYEHRDAELYDLSSDPDERTNLIAGEADTSTKLRAELDAWVERNPSAARPEPFESRDERARAELRALGYAE